MSEPLTFQQVLDEISGDRWTGAWFTAGGLWIWMPHDANEDQVAAAMNELMRRARRRAPAGIVTAMGLHSGWK